MLFNSYIFVLFFLPVCLIGYFSLNHSQKYHLAQAFLLLMSLWFYGYQNPYYLIIIISSVIGNYLVTRLMAKTENRNLRKWEMIGAVVLNFGVLFYFKYYNFFLSNLNQVFSSDFTLKNIVLPLGISFFTFQQVSYVIDAYRGEVQQYPFLQYACFVTYFPQLVAGPIVTHDELIPQFLDENKKTFNWDNFAKGLFMFTLGLSKKVLLADTFGRVADWGFADVQALDTTNALLVTLAYTIQIYFDFSGYSDMAVGMGKMMNIDIPLNFDSPYVALTITDFWKRWHKTLTRFLTKYIYIPLGGNRKGEIRTYVNILVVFLASGIWHGANYTFILWGLLHGFFQVITRRWKSVFEKMHPALSWLITFAFVSVTFALFRADSVSDALTIVKRLLLMDCGDIDYNITTALMIPELQYAITYFPFMAPLKTFPTLLIPLLYGGSLFLILGCKNAYHKMQTFTPSWKNLLVMVFLLVWCISSFASVSTFLYFNF